MSDQPIRNLFSVIERDGRYPLPAYRAVQLGLHHLIKKRGAPGHVTGQELTLGISDYLKQEYGPFVSMVLEGWNVNSTFDFGRIVYNMIECGLMSKQETDSIRDFSNVFDFDTMFDSSRFDWLCEIRKDYSLQPNPDRFDCSA